MLSLLSFPRQELMRLLLALNAFLRAEVHQTGDNICTNLLCRVLIGVAEAYYHGRQEPTLCGTASRSLNDDVLLHLLDDVLKGFTCQFFLVELITGNERCQSCAAINNQR